MNFGEQCGTRTCSHRHHDTHNKPTNIFLPTKRGHLRCVPSEDKLAALRPAVILSALTVLLANHVGAGPLVARFETVLGNFEVLMDPVSAPLSVWNFAAYANRGKYDLSIIHRSTTYNASSIQIVQGGGYQLVGNTITPLATDPPIALEANLPNRRGTIAMARTAVLNSATSQWFLNVSDNPALDFNYAVFGRVLGTGQSVIDAMGSVPVYDTTQQIGFSEIPLRQPYLAPSSLVTITRVRVETLAVTNLSCTPTGVELRWNTLSTNTPLRIERAPNLEGSWSIIASNLTTGVFTDTNAPPSGAFYRLVAAP